MTYKADEISRCRTAVISDTHDVIPAFRKASRRVSRDQILQQVSKVEEHKLAIAGARVETTNRYKRKAGDTILGSSDPRTPGLGDPRNFAKSLSTWK